MMDSNQCNATVTMLSSGKPLWPNGEFFGGLFENLRPIAFIHIATLNAQSVRPRKACFSCLGQDITATNPLGIQSLRPLINGTTHSEFSRGFLTEWANDPSGKEAHDMSRYEQKTARAVETTKWGSNPEFRGHLSNLDARRRGLNYTRRRQCRLKGVTSAHHQGITTA
jgi:hypothetical protein